VNEGDKMSTINKLASVGQSLWYDNIRRRLLENGEIKTMIERGDIRGMTSNPSIFQKAIGDSHDYDSAILPLAWAGWEPERIFWQLATEDIQHAADLFQPLYESTDGGDGYVSIEVGPELAHDTQTTLSEVRRLWRLVDRPNLMIKIPATAEGIPAIRQAIAEGVNVNITLIFSLARYAQVMDAYLSGLEQRLGEGLPIDRIASVASFFVSRVDTKVDGRLDAIVKGEGSGAKMAARLLGRAAVANAKLAYAEFQKVFEGDGRFAKLKEKGARLQRPLWASTSTKNPDYSDVKYVDELIGPHTVNTVPPNTLEDFRDHGKVKVVITDDLEDERRALDELEALGISMQQVTQELEDEGVEAFAKAFRSLLETIGERCGTVRARLGHLRDSVPKRIQKLEADSVSKRLHDMDPTLWTSDPGGQAEVKIRMGWLDLPETSRKVIPELKTFAEEIRQAGLERVLVLGMGGSSLAPEVLSKVFAEHEVQFAILDSTDPAQVESANRNFPPEESLYIVASKSGTTAEPNVFFQYFWEQAKGDGSHFVAITDPNTPLEVLAKEKGFRKAFQADPHVGGRYSALTHFGLVPAALLGIDLERLLDRADWMREQCAPEVPTARNPGLALGAVMGEAALAGRDKLTILADEAIRPLGSWLEQLIAESSGKHDKGILPVDVEPLGEPAVYGQDRLFVYLRQSGEMDEGVEKLRRAGHPVIVYHIEEAYDLAAEFYRWEVAIAVACHILGVNAFDQPNVQDSKDRTKSKIADYQKKSSLDEGQPAWQKGDFKVFSSGQVNGSGLPEVLKSFLSQAKAGNYVAINAYLPRNQEMTEALQQARLAIRSRTHCATTLGFGPRFQHSTGQLHKGGPNTGLFLQITATPSQEVPIPREALSFGTMELAQALGDNEALVARGRRVIRLHLPAPQAVKALVDALK
jgi:transaldolase/glucose-6-phosphate isomerase